MRKLFTFGAVIVVSMAMLMTACKKDEVNNNSNNSSNTENPGGSSGSGSYEYPSSAVVFPNAVTDIDGNSYDAVQIGDQVWMAKNLCTTRYADSTTIELGTNSSYDTPLRYTSGIDITIYGYVYNWAAVMHGASSSNNNPSGIQGICPNGWHVPSDAEWIQLTDYLSSHSEYVCDGTSDKIAKAIASQNDWPLSAGGNCSVGVNLHANNITGFSALPNCSYFDGTFGDFGYAANFWSTTETSEYDAYWCGIADGSAYVYRYTDSKNIGFSVRCLRD